MVIKSIKARQLTFNQAIIFAKPFLKWAGGKSQLLNRLQNYFPPELENGKIKRYFEPFLGSGALFFYLAQNYFLEEIFLSDVNFDLVSVFQTVQTEVETLIEILLEIQNIYHALSLEEQKQYFYQMRDAFNQKDQAKSYRTAQLIFLNKTCFNGLYRVNSKGGYNVPFGDYANPTICDAQNLRACSRLLKKAHIVKADYENIEAEVNKASFVYFDPPYRPLSKTANFTSYSAPEFGETAQVNLARFYRKLSDEREAKLLLSNSDPQNTDRTDNFFENHYAGFTINRINASRAINSKANGRGPITEILITNFLPPANSGLLEEILLNKL